MGDHLKACVKQVNILALFEYLLMLLTLLYSSMWTLFVPAKSNEFLRFAYPVMTALLLLRRQDFNKQRIRRLIFVAVLLAVYLLFTRYNTVRYVLYYAVPLLVLMVYIGICDECGTAVGLLHKLADIVTALAAISLVCYLLGTCLDILPWARETTYFWASETRTCTTYYHLYYEAQSTDMFGLHLVRNCGIFTEAPGYAVFLIIALATEMFLRKQPRVWRLVLLCVTVITTYSTKAVLLAVGVFGLHYIITAPRTPLQRRLKRIILPIVCVAGAAVAVILLIDKMNTESFYIRIDDLLASLKTWWTSPLFGTGYYNDESVIAQFAYPRPNNGLSMGLPVLLAQGGLFLVALYIVAASGYVLRQHGGDRWKAASFFTVYFALMFVSNMPFSFLALLVLALSLESGRRC